MEYKELMESRASVYWFLSTLFAKELSQEQLSALTTGEGAQFLTQLAATPEFQPAIAQMQNALGQLTPNNQAALELSAEFTSAFLMDFKQSAPPYASVYISEDHLLMQQPHQAMLQQLTNLGMSVDSNFQEPADHIAIQLDCMGNLILQAIENPNADALIAQRSFMTQHLLNWIDLFAAHIAKLPTSSSGAFYPAVVQFTQCFLHQDAEWLKHPDVYA